MPRRRRRRRKFRLLRRALAGFLTSFGMITLVRIVSDRDGVDIRDDAQAMLIFSGLGAVAHVIATPLEKLG